VADRRGARRAAEGRRPRDLVDDVQPNWSACGKYGREGCPFKAQCLIHQSKKEQSMPSVMQLLQKTPSTSVPTPPPASPPQAQASTPAPQPAVTTTATKPSGMQIEEGNGFAAKLAKPGEKYLLADGRVGTFTKVVDTGGPPLFAFDVGAPRPALLDAEELIRWTAAPAEAGGAAEARADRRLRPGPGPGEADDHGAGGDRRGHRAARRGHGGGEAEGEAHHEEGAGGGDDAGARVR
jgi:hypothetical protein